MRANRAKMGEMLCLFIYFYFYHGLQGHLIACLCGCILLSAICFVVGPNTLTIEGHKILSVCVHKN